MDSYEFVLNGGGERRATRSMGRRPKMKAGLIDTGDSKLLPPKLGKEISWESVMETHQLLILGPRRILNDDRSVCCQELIIRICAAARFDS